MATIVVNRGLQVAVGRLSSTADSFAALQSMAVDDRSTAFVATDTSLGSPANVAAKAFDATPTRSAQTVTHETTFATTEANFTIRRISLHNAAAGSVNGTSTTLCMGVDGQSLTKTSDFSVKFILRVTTTDQS